VQGSRRKVRLHHTDLSHLVQNITHSQRELTHIPSSSPNSDTKSLPRLYSRVSSQDHILSRPRQFLAQFTTLFKKATTGRRVFLFGTCKYMGMIPASYSQKVSNLGVVRILCRSFSATRCVGSPSAPTARTQLASATRRQLLTNNMEPSFRTDNAIFSHQ